MTFTKWLVPRSRHLGAWASLRGPSAGAFQERSHGLSAIETARNIGGAGPLLQRKKFTWSLVEMGPLDAHDSSRGILPQACEV